MAGQQGQPKYGFGWPDGRLGGLGPAGSAPPVDPHVNQPYLCAMVAPGIRTACRDTELAY